MLGLEEPEETIEVDSYPRRRRFRADRDRMGKVGWAVVVLLSGLHAWGIWAGLGGREQIRNDAPIPWHDHPLQYHAAVIGGDFLKRSGTNAGYDPSFMSGYARSVIFPTSTTLAELSVVCLGFLGVPSVQAFKSYVWAATSSAPWFLVLAGLAWRLKPSAIAAAVGLFLIYVWTDWPINYVYYGMVGYFTSIPIALCATAWIGRFLDDGGFGRWAFASVLTSLAWLVHVTTAQTIAPAALSAYLIGWGGSRRSSAVWKGSRHLGFWLIPVVVLATNVFWWLPGISLAKTAGASDVAFYHHEPVLARIGRIFSAEPTIEAVLWGLGLFGFAAVGKRGRGSRVGVIGFSAAGFAWGYLAGWSPRLDFLQPGRHTFACYSGLALAGGAAWAWAIERLGKGSPRLSVWSSAATILIAVRIFGPSIQNSLATRLLGSEPFLSSRPPRELTELTDCLKTFLKPGDRLLYEEAGKTEPGGIKRDPFRGARYSGLLPHLIPGVELIGGPYLHASLATNFTQFGEGKLFEKKHWTRLDFDRHARLYRPSAIVCFSPWAKAFCEANGDLVRIVARRGPFLIGRVRGYEGDTIFGQAIVDAKPGRLLVRDAVPDLDGKVVLRYHFSPCMRIRPASAIEPIILEDDPVPFVALRPGGSDRGPWTIDLHVIPRLGGSPSPRR